MSETPESSTSDGASPVPRRVRLLGLLKVLLVVDLAVILALLAAWWTFGRDDERATHGNDGLRGTVAPRGETMLRLDQVRGLVPAFPSPASLRGGAVLVVGTCLDCQSGDVIGGAMARLADRGVPRGARVHVVTWDGDGDAWRTRWGLSAPFVVHHASTERAREDAKRLLRLDDTGYAYLYDARGRWRSSFPVQLMQSEDVVHDMRIVARK